MVAYRYLADAELGRYLFVLQPQTNKLNHLTLAVTELADVFGIRVRIFIPLSV